MVIREDLIDEVIKILDELADFGRDDQNGVTRLLYDSNWKKAQRYLEDKFREKGLVTFNDEVGNLFGHLPGSSDETILTGSHIDTVVSGGKLDGQYGIAAGLVAIAYLNSVFGQPKKSLEVVSMAEEEGSRFPFTFWGSKNIAGRVEPSEVIHLTDGEGNAFKDVMTDAGFRFKDEGPPREDIKAFIELHIEQGGVLESEDVPIGLVEHIVGQNRSFITLEGQANHAGTTPMSYRRDALYASARIIESINARAKAYGDPLVATVGMLQVYPNTSNVVPAKVQFSLDVRHTDGEVILQFAEDVRNLVEATASELGMEAHIENYMSSKPVPMCQKLVALIRERFDRQGIPYRMVHSGAGHDAQIMADRFSTAMIFVPSHLGISHNPAEYTAPEHLAQGLRALIESLYALAYLDA